MSGLICSEKCVLSSLQRLRKVTSQSWRQVNAYQLFGAVGSAFKHGARSQTQYFLKLENNTFNIAQSYYSFIQK